jgi:hypothetical protein
VGQNLLTQPNTPPNSSPRLAHCSLPRDCLGAQVHTRLLLSVTDQVGSGIWLASLGTNSRTSRRVILFGRWSRPDMQGIKPSLTVDIYARRILPLATSNYDPEQHQSSLCACRRRQSGRRLWPPLIRPPLSHRWVEKNSERLLWCTAAPNAAAPATPAHALCTLLPSCTSCRTCYLLPGAWSRRPLRGFACHHRGSTGGGSVVGLVPRQSTARNGIGCGRIGVSSWTSSTSSGWGLLGLPLYQVWAFPYLLMVTVWDRSRTVRTIVRALIASSKPLTAVCMAFYRGGLAEERNRRERGPGVEEGAADLGVRR